MIRFNLRLFQHILVLIVGLTVSQVAFAQSTTAGDVMRNLQNTVPAVVTLILMISFLLGIIFIHKGLSLLKKFGLPPGHMMQQGELLQPLKYIFIGALLVYLPSTEVVFSNTLLGGNNASAIARTMDISKVGTISERMLGETGSSRLSSYWQEVINTLVLYIQVLGLVSFIRGWIIISKPAQGGQGTVGKGITHIIAGIIAINFVDVVIILRNTVLGTS